MTKSTYKRGSSNHDRNSRSTILRRNTCTPKKCLLCWMIPFMILFYFVVLLFGHYLFDNHSLRGGELGRMVDTLGRTIIFRRTMQKRTALLDKLRIQLPPMTDVINKKGIPNLPQAAVAEILIRNKIRARQIQATNVNALQWISKCDTADKNSTMIPNLLLQPDHGDFFRPVYDAPALEVIRFDHYTMRKTIQDQFPLLLPKFDKTVDKTEQTLIWSLCALYAFGGYVFGQNYRSVDDNIDSFIGANGGCDPFSVVVFRQERNSSTGAVAVDMMVMASTPRHPRLKRVIENLAEDTGESIDTLSMIAALYGVPVQTKTKQLVAQHHNGWEELSCQCSKQFVDKDESCCKKVQTGPVENVLLQQRLSTSSRLARVYIKIVDSEREYDQAENHVSCAVEVSITDRGTHAPVKVPKATIYERLSSLNCNAGWICNRCLKNALLGTHDACTLVCPSCYKEVICKETDNLPKKPIDIDILVQETRTRLPEEQQIPKIIHQTWFDEPTVDRYPQLVRLQNSWKSQGWDYRFYKDDDVREYIAKNYSSRFLDAFDSIVPGAFKADFFRYLVLLKDGGIYADADIMLDMKLDSFITPSMSFFVPRDIVGDYAGENFCLWNGMIGAVAGHPFMIQAAELLLNNILNRVDYYDMEREMCRALGTSGEVWKMRALTILSLSGPCLLGSAVNKALGQHNYLSKYDSGWFAPAKANQTKIAGEIGDALLLIASRADMGALRFSDVDRNMIVASTGMNELSKDPISSVDEIIAQAQKGEGTSHVHYSQFEHVNDVFGADGIYVDNLVTNEEVTLVVHRLGVKK